MLIILDDPLSTPSSLDISWSHPVIYSDVSASEEEEAEDPQAQTPGRPLIQKSIPNVRPTVLKKDPYQGLIFYETKPHIKDFSLAKTKFHGHIVN